MFTERYNTQNIPWDTGITPPEIVAITEELSPGCALDLGCGTGTNIRYLLERGWHVDGVDYVQQAIEQATTKLANFPVQTFALYCHDVSQLKTIALQHVPYDLVIDIGCGHGLEIDKAMQYAQDVASLMKPGGTWMIYAHQPSEERPNGWTPTDVQHIFTEHFELVWQVLSHDTTSGSPAGWYRLRAR